MSNLDVLEVGRLSITRGQFGYLRFNVECLHCHNLGDDPGGGDGERTVTQPEWITLSGTQNPGRCS